MMPGTNPSAYQRGLRRVLVDHEIPAWDERFLAEYDPAGLADLYLAARAQSVMFVCKTLHGWCFWPTEVGAEHPRLDGRDIVAETVDCLRERGLAPCAYYSVIFDNWPAERNPEWQFVPLGGHRLTDTPHDRHGLCCPNSPGYRDYISAQIADLFGRYEFEAAFCDMSFWPGACGCEACRERFRAEVGGELPEVIDWTDERWCSFQAARERWIDEFTGLVTGAMQEASPGIAVYHNFAPAPGHWSWAVPFSVTEHCDFLGGDLYGDEVEQLLIMKLMNGLSRSRPVEYMTFATTSAYEHISLKSRERMRTQVSAATAEASAFMFIEAIDPEGTAAAANYELIGEAFEPAIEWDGELDGAPLADVALYFSNASKMDFAENGKRAGDPIDFANSHPHLRALRGATEKLQRAHVPFAVVTRRDLGRLADFPVLVLPQLARIDEEEAAAFRAYVDGGGALYASGYTSLVETRGVRHDDFLLADVFGVDVEGAGEAGTFYATPATERTRAWLEPQRHLTCELGGGGLDGRLLRLRAAPEAEVLATATETFAPGKVGSFADQEWSSIHADPPWRETRDPVLVANRFGAGRAVYSAFDLPAQETEADARLFAAVVDHLLGDRRTLRCETHPSVWCSAFEVDGGIRVALRNGPPALQTGARLELRAPAGRRFTRLTERPSGRELDFEVTADGGLRVDFETLPALTMVVAHHEEAGS